MGPDGARNLILRIISEGRISQDDAFGRYCESVGFKGRPVRIAFAQALQHLLIEGLASCTTDDEDTIVEVWITEKGRESLPDAPKG